MSTQLIENAKLFEQDLFPAQAQALIAENLGSKDFTVIDVSTPGEFSGHHLDQAVNISFFSSSFKSRVSGLDPNHTYLLYCKLGCRSKMAKRIMVRKGFHKVYNLKGGTLLWEEEGLPLVSDGKRIQRRFCPASFFVKGVRKTKRFFGLNTPKEGCTELDPNCLCDGQKMVEPKIDKKWMDCCR